MLALIPLRPFPLPGPVSLSRLKKNKQTNDNNVNNKHRRGSSKTHGGGRAGGRYESRRTALVVLTSVLPQHPIAVRVDEPGASRSFTKLQLSSSGVWNPTGAGRVGEGQSRALCLHALTAQRRDPGGGARSGDVPTVSLSSPSR